MRIDATYNVATPMFCGGVDPRNSAELRLPSFNPDLMERVKADGPRNSAELRLPSFKGVLRFWWRALAWPRCGGNLNEIRQQEDKLFGSASGGQSRVLMKLDPRDGKPKAVERDSVLDVFGRSGVKPVGAGARYLGYGVMETLGNHKKNTKAGQLTRPCLQVPFQFTVQIRCPGLGAEEERSLQDALIALGTLGGMGAKSRKGYGSLVLRSLRVDGEDNWKPPSDVDGLEHRIRDLRRNMSGELLPEYTAVSTRSRQLLLSSDRPQPLEMLDLVGQELVRYRSWKRNGRILQSVNPKGNFEDGHDLAEKPSGSRRMHPPRIAFGLPRNYGKRKDQQVRPRAPDLDRRASPLFIHIHECGSTPVAVLSFLPARFLPKGQAEISVGGKSVDLKPVDDLYCPIHDFLDHLLDLGRRKKHFADAVEVGQ